MTPLVRKLASEHGVDLAAVSGTGVGGRIRKQDVVAAADEQDQQKARRRRPSRPSSEAAPAAGGRVRRLRPGAVHGGEVQKPAGRGAGSAAIPTPDESGCAAPPRSCSRRRATIA